jgi:hypothetical protein
MLFWTLVGLVVLAVEICTVVAVAMIRATHRSDFD